MQYQLRRFKIATGRMDDFLDAWLAGVYPLRRQHGFTFVGAWRVEEKDEFVWIIGYDGPEGFAEADRRYYASSERRSMEPDPARFIESSATEDIHDVLGRTEVDRT